MGPGGKPDGEETGEETKEFPGDAEVGFGTSGAAAAEGDGDFAHGADTAANQNLKQKLEAGGLERDVPDTAAANEKVAGHGVRDAQATALQGAGKADGGDGDKAAERVPAVAGRAAVAAGDREVTALEDSGDEGGQHFGRVLQISIDDAQQVSRCILPSVKNRSREAAHIAADEEPDAGIVARDRSDEFRRAIAAVVIDNQDLAIEECVRKRCLKATEKRGESGGFAERGDDEGDTGTNCPSGRRCRGMMRLVG